MHCGLMGSAQCNFVSCQTEFSILCVMCDQVHEKVVDYTSESCLSKDAQHNDSCADIVKESPGTVCQCTVVFSLSEDFPVCHLFTCI